MIIRLFYPNTNSKCLHINLCLINYRVELKLILDY